MAFTFEIDGTRHEVRILARLPQLVLAVDGRPVRIDDPGPAGTGLISLVIEGIPHQIARLVDLPEVTLRAEGVSRRVIWIEALAEAPAEGGLSELRAPMPGVVIELHQRPGSRLAVGDPILTIESMKLQTVITAPRAGVLGDLPLEVGALFGKDDLLARLIEEGGEDA